MHCLKCATREELLSAMNGEVEIDHEYYQLPPCDCTGVVCVRGPRENSPPLGRRCRCDGELIKST